MEKIALGILQNGSFQIVLGVPILCNVFLSTVWGSLNVIFAVSVAVLLYIIETHRIQKQSFEEQFKHILRDQGADPGGPQTLTVAALNLIVNKWWKTAGPYTFRDILVPKLQNLINASKPGFVDEIWFGNFEYDPINHPRVLEHSIDKKTANNLISNKVKISWDSDIVINLDAVVSTYRVPIQIRDISFVGFLRIDIVVPGAQTDQYQITASILNEAGVKDHLIKYSVKIANKLDIGGIPALSEWLDQVLDSAIQKAFVFPSVLYILGNCEKSQVLPQISNQSNDLEFADLATGMAVDFRDPIVDLAVTFPNHEASVLPGFQILDKSYFLKLSANFNSGTNGHPVYLCFKRGTGKPITNVRIFSADEIQKATSEGFTVITKSIGGLDANLNAGTNNFIKLYLGYQKGDSSPILDIGVIFCDEDETIPDGYIRVSRSVNDGLPNGKECYVVFSTSQSMYRFQEEKKRSALVQKVSSKQTAGFLPKLSFPTSTKRRQLQAKQLGIDEGLKEFVTNLCLNPDIFYNFPVEDKKSAEEFSMNPKQLSHAQLVLEEVPHFRRLHAELTPAHLSDRMFWFIYFALVGNRLKHTLQENKQSSREQLEDDWVL